MTLGEDAWDDFAVCGGSDEALVEALVGEVEAVGVDAEEVEEGGLEVADADRVFGGVVADVIGLTIDAGFDAGACHPHREGVRVVVAADEAFLELAVHVVLHHGGAPEFAAPDDEGFIEKAALFEICEEAGDRFVDLLAFDGEGLVDGFAEGAAVVVPTPIVELYEADAIFRTM